MARRPRTQNRAEQNFIEYPANAPGALAVGGIDATGQRFRIEILPDFEGFYNGSSFGPGLRFVAPAMALFTTDREGALGFTPGNWINETFLPSGNTLPLFGTSFATPLVAGVAALVRARHPELSAATVDQILCDTAAPVPNWDRTDDSRVEPPPACGLVDATAAMLAADALVVFLDGFETGDTSQWSQEVQ